MLLASGEIWDSFFSMMAFAMEYSNSASRAKSTDFMVLKPFYSVFKCACGKLLEVLQPTIDYTLI